MRQSPFLQQILSLCISHEQPRVPNSGTNTSPLARRPSHPLVTYMVNYLQLPVPSPQSEELRTSQHTSTCLTRPHVGWSLSLTGQLDTTLALTAYLPHPVWTLRRVDN